MDKNAIKRFAVWARRELIIRVSQRAVQYEITENGYGDYDAESVNGRIMSPSEKSQRKALIDRIRNKGYEQVMEEVAYTWFNRFSALRFMEVNGYLPSRVRVFTDDDNNFKPQIITDAIDLAIDGLDMEKVYELKDDATKEEELYKYLLITQCNALSSILPKMFQKISDYTELLFPDNLLREGSVIQQMIEIIPQEDWQDAVQIIGWLYQYYNSEKKDEVFAALKKNVKITKENIPAATQLFTPDWIVRYMVENSLGRLWVEGHPNDELQNNWKYYIKEAEQEPDVQSQLAKIRKEYGNIKPEDIRVIDPCSGSGHILAYLFDVLMQIYDAYGYTTREAVDSIVTNNIYGLDIDERAAQLAHFAVMMQARKYDSRFLKRTDDEGKPCVPQPHVYEIRESNHIDAYVVDELVGENAELKKAMDTILSEMHDAKEYGSILTITPQDWSTIYAHFDEYANSGQISMYTKSITQDLLPIVQIAEILAQRYDVVVTNPPYMGNMPTKMTELVQQKYADSKYDLYSVFMERSFMFAKTNGMISLITQHTWMFISSFERLRAKLMDTSYISILHLGTRAFEDINGEVVQTTTMIWRNSRLSNNMVISHRLVDYSDTNEKEKAFLANDNVYFTKQDNFSLLPGCPVVYWLQEPYFEAIKNNVFIEEYVDKKAGVVTGNDNYFLKLWYETNINDISFLGKSAEEYGKYHVMSKGGGARRFYGNYEYVIKLCDLWNPSKTNVSVRRGDADYYFRKAIGWSQVGNAQKTFRYTENSVCGTATPTVYLKNNKYYFYILAFLNTKISYEYLCAYNPTINLLTTDICNLPLIIKENLLEIIDSLTMDSIKLCKNDWDSYETSWDFKRHPLLDYMIKDEKKITMEKYTKNVTYIDTDTKIYFTIKNAFDNWKMVCENYFNQLKANEEELNRIFIDIYGLQDELTSEVEDKDVTVRKADLHRDIKSFISYAVGCMFGRYSLDVDGLVYAGGEWVTSKYQTFKVDSNNIIPICDDEYFEDDIVGRFVEFVKVVYGADTVDENLKFIADALGGSGQPRDVIRKYFMSDFYADHCKMYQKRPIYWLFDSGKKNGFKALIYMHRYQPDTIARMRTDYVHEQQARYRTALETLEHRINGVSGSDKVKLDKRMAVLRAQTEEIGEYEEKIHHLADQMIGIDLDNGVKYNYEIFKDVLAKIK